MNTAKQHPLQKIPVYEVRLVQARRALRLRESTIDAPSTSARALHALIGTTDREHFACLFLNNHHHVTGAHIIAVGGQHLIATIDVRTLFRAALAACAAGIILSHYVPRNIMRILFPVSLCAGGAGYGPGFARMAT